MWDKILEYLNDNKDALGWLFGSGVVLAVLGGIYRFIIWLFREYRLRKIRTNDNFPFKIIPPNSNVAKEILGGADDDPLADRNIPYQQRIPGQNTRRELEELIEDNRWVLINGQTGLGKTREAVQLAQSLNNEGWTVLYLTREVWLDAPAKLPNNVPERKLLFFLDDLNKKCHSSKAETRPNSSESLISPIYEPFQTRLQRTLEAFNIFCGKSEIKVIATARNEKTSEFDEPSEWDKLGWTKYSSLWEKFKLVDLPEPEKAAEQKLLEETAKMVNILIALDELPILAKRNDGTFRNLVENISYARTEGFRLSSESFRDTLKGTWQKRYQKATQKHAEAKYIYDAIELLRNIGIKLKYSTVIRVSDVFIKGGILKRMHFRWRCFSALNQLVKTENILNPRDGQIEAKGYKNNFEEFIPTLYFEITKEFVSSYPIFRRIDLYTSLFLTPKSFFIYDNLSLGGKIYGAIMPIASALNNVGHIYNLFGYPTQGLALLEKSLELKQWNLFYRFVPKYKITSWIGLGNSYYQLHQYEKAIEIYRKAVKISPKSALPWSNLGILYYEMNYYDEALKAFQEAIDKDKKPDVDWGNLGILYLTNNKIDDAILAFSESIKINQKYSYSIISLASCLRKLGNNLEAEKHINSIEPFIEDEIDYVQACFFVAKGDIEKGLILLRDGWKKQVPSKIWAQKDPNFEIIRDNPRFKEIIGLE